jgi:hypothetical protein
MTVTAPERNESMTAATKSKSKPSTPAEAIRNIGRDIRTAAAAEWKRWAIALADGEGAPDGRELVNVAAALQIPDPANALEAAAAAVLEVRVMQRGLADCERALTELLAPYGGQLAKLLAAVEAAKVELERLQGIAYVVGNQGNRSYYTSTIHQARMRHPHIWPGYEATGRAGDI